MQQRRPLSAIGSTAVLMAAVAVGCSSPDKPVDAEPPAPSATETQLDRSLLAPYTQAGAKGCETELRSQLNLPPSATISPNILELDKTGEPSMTRPTDGSPAGAIFDFIGEISINNGEQVDRKLLDCRVLVIEGKVDFVNLDVKDAAYDAWLEASKARNRTGYEKYIYESDKRTCAELLKKDAHAVQTLFTSYGVGREAESPDVARESDIARNVIIAFVCPDAASLITKAQNPDYHRTEFGNGSHPVGNGRDRNSVHPGTYAIEGSVKDCYWERTDAQGNIIDNNFITYATALFVTIEATDASFSSKNCSTAQRQWTYQTG